MPVHILLLGFLTLAYHPRPDLEASSAPLPNIIWLVAEDQSPMFFPMYGDSTVTLPHLQSLSRDGVVFTNAYAPVPVCAPARSAIITGLYPTSMGTHNMRTYNAYAENNQPEIGIPSYSPIPPEGTRMFTEYLRAKGYYCSNNAKEDYNFRPPPSAWDESSGKAHWRNRPESAPFFSVFNFGVCHESQVWARGKDTIYVAPQQVPVPPYFPDNATVRHDLAVNYSNLVRLDEQIGIIIDQLKADGLYDNSYILFYSDHGGPFPRHKRSLYETGIKVPLIIKFPGNMKAAGKDERLISFIDLAPTMLSLAGIEPPGAMQGKALFGPFRDAAGRTLVFATSDRFDGVYDRLRAVRKGRFKYIRNYHVDKSNALPVKYREQMPMMQSLMALWNERALNSLQALWFRTPKPEEELYDLKNDPWELHNLADIRPYRDTLSYFRKILKDWVSHTNDLGRIPEKKLISRWAPEGRPPRLCQPEAVITGSEVRLRAAREDATILWRPVRDSIWQFYTGPFHPDQPLEAMAVRIGYEDSPVARVLPE